MESPTMSSFHDQKVNTPTKSRPSTSSSSHYDMSSQSISLPGSKTTLLVEDMEQDAERLPSLDILLKDLRNSLQEVVATTAPQNLRNACDKPKTPDSDSKPIPDTTVLIEDECKREEDGTIIYKLNRKFIKKRKSILSLASIEELEMGSLPSLVDKTTFSYNKDVKGKRGEVVETMLDSTLKQQEDEVNKYNRDRARQKHLKEVAIRIKQQMEAHINAQLAKETQKAKTEPDKNKTKANKRYTHSDKTVV